MNIVIADDSLLSRSYLKKILTVVGYSTGTVFEAENGRDALRLVTSHEVKCLFLDINMPIMTGIELIDILVEKNLLGNMDIIITSSLADTKCIEMLKAKGIQYFLRKPFTPESMAKITDLLKEKAA